MENSKIVNLDALDKIAKELRRKALADISQQEEEIEKVRDMFGGKSFRYVLQEEYDNLSEEEKKDPSIVWNIIDAEEPVSKEYVDEEVAKINDMLQHMGEGIKAELDKKSDILNYSDYSLNGTETYNNLEKVIGSGSEAIYIINKTINLIEGTTCSVEVKFSDNTNLLLQGEVISIVLHEKQVTCIQITGSGTAGLMVIDKARYTIKDGSGAPEHDDNVSSLLVLHPNANNVISLTITKPTVFEINNSFFTNYQFVNDTEKENWNNKADKNELFSGDYNDLINKPEMPNIEGLASESYVQQEIAKIQTNNNIIEAELDLLLEEIFGINSKNELTSVRLGNYQMKYDNVNDTLDFLYNGTIDEPEVPPTTEEEIIPLVWAVGNLSGTDGSETVQENSLRSDFATIVSGSTYSFYLDAQMGDPTGVRIYFYDSSKTFISRTSGYDLNYTTGVDIPIDIPSNTGYIRFKANLDSSTTLDNINSLVTLRKRKIEVNNYVTEGLSMYIDANDVATYGSIRDITGKQSITNHGVSTTLDNGCLNFVASESDYIDCGFVPNLSTWSTEIYAYFTSTPTDTANLYCWGSSNSNRIRVGYSGSDKAMTILANTTKQQIGDVFLTLQHLVVTANNGTYIVYINGVQQYTFSSEKLASHTNNMVIGTSSYSADSFADMNLKIFRHYDGKVLSAEEVLQNYNYEINRNENIIQVTWIDNKNINYSGAENDDTSAMVTDYLTKEDGYNYTINLTDVSTVKLYFFNSSKTFISRTDNLTVNSTDILIEFPENTSYFRLKSDKGTATVNNANDYIILKKVTK